MIARLNGILAQVDDGSVVIEVGGVGYLVFCSSRTLAAMPTLESPIKLHIETHVREDHIHLFGFTAVVERDWFRLLTTVQGVGNRVALAILGILAPDALANALIAQDKAAFTAADGVGPKLAGRIVSELKDKVGAIVLSPLSGAAGAASDAANTTAASGLAAAAGGADPVIADAVSALVNLGYGRAEAFGAVAQARRDLPGDASLDALIPLALRELGR